jgi:uncharacterized Tic20 family protein
MSERDIGDDQLTGDDRNFAVLAHLLGILISFLGPLVVWLVKRESSEFVDDQGKEALNFQITVILAQIVAGILVPVLAIGCVLLPVVLVANIIFCIVAAVAASQGRRYRYPVALRLIS